MHRLRVRKRLWSLGVYLLAAIVVLILIFPLYNVVLMSVQYEVDIRSRNMTLIPRYITLEHYQEVLRPGHIVPIRAAMQNSFIISALTGLFCTSIGAMAGYALARLRFRAKKAILYGLSSIYLFPGLLFVIPLFTIAVKLGLTDTVIGLLIPYSAFILPFTLWFLKSYFEKLPFEIEEAAIVDGAGLGQLFFRVIFPLSIPGLVTAFVFGFILSWIEFLTPLVFTTGRMPILTVALGLYRSTVDIKVGQLAAAAVLALLPVVLLTLVCQRWIVSGLLAGYGK